MPSIEQLKIKIFCDGADLKSILQMSANPLIKGFTTNPTLMHKAGIKNYEAFGRELLGSVVDRPISLEVFADDHPTMERQARTIASWGSNVNVKIPVTNTRGEFSGPIIERLSRDGVIVNVTAVFTLEQVALIADALDPNTAAIVSVFAGRIADTGVDPVPHMEKALAMLRKRPKAELLWASPRELLNVFHADSIGCHVITATPDILAKLALVGKDLDAYSLETVEMFYMDATSAGYNI